MTFITILVKNLEKTGKWWYKLYMNIHQQIEKTPPAACRLPVGNVSALFVKTAGLPRMGWHWLFIFYPRHLNDGLRNPSLRAAKETL